MKIVVIGGTGLIGSKVVTKLTAQGHEAIAASPNSGVNTLTGEGVAEVLVGASVVVDVSNSPSFEDNAVMNFFQTSTRNLLTAEAAAGVKHHVALSVVGTERLSESGYMRAKIVQEKLIKESSIPYSIVHCTQFFEFSKGIADSFTVDGKVHVPPVLIQPIAGEEVSSAVARIAIGAPVNGIVEVAGPERFQMDDFIRQVLTARNDSREIVIDSEARYFGALLEDKTLVASDDAQVGQIRIKDWLANPANQPPAPNPQPHPQIELKENEFRISDVPPGSALRIGDVAVFNVAGSYYATQSLCTHMKGELAKGKLEGSTLTCPKHGAQFNVTSGAVLRGPATESLQTYTVNIDGDIGRVQLAEASVAKAN